MPRPIYYPEEHADCAEEACVWLRFSSPDRIVETTMERIRLMDEAAAEPLPVDAPRRQDRDLWLLGWLAAKVRARGLHGADVKGEQQLYAIAMLAMLFEHGTTAVQREEPRLRRAAARLWAGIEASRMEQQGFEMQVAA